MSGWGFLLKTRQKNALSGFILGVSSLLISLAISIYVSPTELAIAQVSSGNVGRGESRLITPEEVRSIIKKARDIWMAGDGAAFATLFIAEGEFIVPGNRWVGRTKIEKAVADFAAAYEVVEIEIRQIIVEGDRAAVEWHWQDREKATGRRSRADDAIVIDFQNGQIGRWREYIDTETEAGQ